jgi:hypothetical protein
MVCRDGRFDRTEDVDLALTADFENRSAAVTHVEVLIGIEPLTQGRQHGGVAIAGAGFVFTTVALDQFNNTTTGYTGTVHFTSSDTGSVTLPANYAFVAGDNGVHTFTTPALATVGAQTITATDTASA